MMGESPESRVQSRESRAERGNEDVTNWKWREVLTNGTDGELRVERGKEDVTNWKWREVLTNGTDGELRVERGKEDVTNWKWREMLTNGTDGELRVESQVPKLPRQGEVLHHFNLRRGATCASYRSDQSLTAKADTMTGRRPNFDEPGAMRGETPRLQHASLGKE